MEDRLVIQYSLKPKDYIRASRALAMKTRGFVLIGIFVILVMLVSAVILLIPSIAGTQWRGIAMIILLMGAFYFIYILAIVPMQLTRAYKDVEHMKKERKFFFSDSGVTVQIENQASTIAWGKIQKAVKGNGLYLLVCIADQKVYPIIPERAFETEEVKAQFLDMLKEKHIPVK
jgi:hypothetical protein